MINPTIEFVLQNGNKHFYVEGQECPVTEVKQASRYPTFQEASSQLEVFQKQNEAVRACVRPVQLVVQLLD